MHPEIWLTSDLHFSHNREFIYRPRGFENIEEMNEAIIENWNKIVKAKDLVFILGDIMLGNNDIGITCLERLNGTFSIVRGNHDTDTRIKLYRESDKVMEVNDAYYYKYGKYHFYMTHYPCLTGNLEKESLTQMTLNLHGHTHSQKKFFYDLPYCYNVGMDSHNCSPISIDQIIYDMENKVQECKQFL